MTIPFTDGSRTVQQAGAFDSGTGDLSFSLAGIPRAPKKALQAGTAQMFRPAIMGDLKMSVTIQGWNVSYDHATAVAEMLPGALWMIVREVGNENTRQSRIAIASYPRPAIDTGATVESIHPKYSNTSTTMMAEVGPTTFYSPLIEFGLGPHFDHGPRPFMTDGYFRTLPGFLAALNELALVAAGGANRINTDPYKPPVNSWIQRFRNRLYRYEKTIGDIVPLGLPGVVQRFRSGLVGSARVLGDIQSVVGRSVAGRISHRLTGKVTGRLIGIGSHTVFGSHQVTTINPGQRLYNREAGKYFSRYTSQTNLFGGFGG